MKDDKAKIKVCVHDESGAQAPIAGALVRLTRTGSPGTKKQQAQAAQTVVAPIEEETDANGEILFDGLVPGTYSITVKAFVGEATQQVTVRRGACPTVDVGVPVGFNLLAAVVRDDASLGPLPDFVQAGTLVKYTVVIDEIDQGHASFSKDVEINFIASRGSLNRTGDREAVLDTSSLGLAGAVTVRAEIRETGSPSMSVSSRLNILSRTVQPISGDVSVTMRRTATVPTPDLPLWVVIRRSTEALSFDRYRDFINLVLCGVDPETKQLLDAGSWKTQVFGSRDNPTVFEMLRRRRFLPYNDVDAYRLLKVATEAFVLINCGVKSEALENFSFEQADVDDLVARVGLDGSFTLDTLQELWTGGDGVEGYLETVNGVKTLLYLKLIRDKLADVRIKRTLFGDNFREGDVPEECFGILETKLSNPCLLELIWSYWHEEGMLVQTMNGISLRFQNRRTSERDPLANLEIDPLRPLNNLIWGYIQDEQHRLTLQRRSYEYLHHYGLRLEGRAIPEMRPADTRSRFIEAFHNLLHLCSLFYKQDDDTTFIADGFPVLNALKEVHRIVAEGAHNQFGDLPSTARIEMLMQQWLLARPEFREYLPTRIMVAYEEPWMDRVDAMKKLKGWTDTSVADFHELAVFGEQIVLSIRYGSWSSIDDREFASNWARYWRSEIQGYIHSYRAVTGVDLTAEFTETRLSREAYLPPSVHLRRRLDAQSGGSTSQRSLPAASSDIDAGMPARMRDTSRADRR